MRLVYDISSYPDHHPGGLEILLEVAGTDATENFDYVGHSSVAEETLKGFELGDLSGYVRKKYVHVQIIYRLTTRSRLRHKPRTHLHCLKRFRQVPLQEP